MGMLIPESRLSSCDVVVVVVEEDFLSSATYVNPAKSSTEAFVGLREGPNFPE